MNKQQANYYYGIITRIQSETTDNGVYQLCEIINHLVADNTVPGDESWNDQQS